MRIPVAVCGVVVALLLVAPSLFGQVVAVPKSYGWIENSMPTNTLTGTGGTITNYSIVQNPLHGQILPVAGFTSNGKWQYLPQVTNFFGSDAFMFRVVAGGVTSAPALVTITVTNINTAPFAHDQFLKTRPGQPLAVTLTADDDYDFMSFGTNVSVTTHFSPNASLLDLHYVLVNSPTNGTLATAVDGSYVLPDLTYTPTAGISNVFDTFTFRATDGSLTSAVATVMIRIGSYNAGTSYFSTNFQTNLTHYLDVPLTNIGTIRPGYESMALSPTNGTVLGTVISGGRTDDGYLQLNLGLPQFLDRMGRSNLFSLYGHNFSNLWINNNGVVSFQAGVASYSPDFFPATFGAVLAPYWEDVDTTSGVKGGIVTLGRGYVNGRPSTLVTWNDVGSYPQSTTGLNRFQVVMIDRSDVGDGFFDYEYNYEYAETMYGSASGGVYPGIGFDAGDGTNYLNYVTTHTPAVAGMPTNSNCGIPGRLFFRSYPATNSCTVTVPPWLSDTSVMLVGDMPTYALTTPSTFVVYSVTNGTTNFFANVTVPWSVAYSTNLLRVTAAVSNLWPDGQYIVRLTNSAAGVGSADLLFSRPKLANVVVNLGTLTPAFSPTNMNYSMGLPLGSNLGVTPTVGTQGDLIEVKWNTNTAAAVVSGTQSPLFTLSQTYPSTNYLAVNIVSTNGIPIRTYTINVVTLPSIDSALSSLSLSAGTITPAFSVNQTNYSLTIPSSIGGTFVSATPRSLYATNTYRINGGAYSTNNFFGLSLGTNAINVRCTAENGTSNTVYAISVIRLASTDNTLAALTLSAGTLSPPFTTNGTTYSATVNVTNVSVTVTGTATYSNATVNIGGSPFVMGTNSSIVALSYGVNSITIRVNSESGIVRSYTVQITRPYPLPVVTTLSPTNVTPTNAMLKGFVDDLGFSTVSYFEYGVTTAYGGFTPTNSVSSTNVTTLLSGLIPTTNYHYRVVATGPGGTATGSDVSFTTPVALPVVTTLPATVTNSDAATLNASVNPGNGLTTTMFQWGATTNYSNVVVTPTISPGVTNVPVSISIGSLAANATFHYRVAANNAAGSVYGNDVTFTTLTPGITSLSPANGPTIGGTLITITGTNLGSAGVVKLSGQTCTISNYSNTQIQFVLPAGQGTGKQVVATIGGYDAVAATLFNYNPPSIGSVTPTNGATVGGIEISLTGTNFGTNGTITFDGQPVASTSYGQSLVKFMLPAGQGINKSIVLSVGGQNASGSFSYNGPSVTNISPNIGPAGGGTEITLAGSNFGTNGTVIFNGQPATNTSYSHNQIKFTLPAGQGLSNAVVVNVGGQLSSPVYFNYYGPGITSVSPNHGPTIGGVEITLGGTNFGTAGNGTVTFNGQGVTLLTYSNTQAKFLLPSGQGTNNSIVVTAGGQVSAATSFSFDGPTITNVSPNVGPAAGGIEITLTGSNFGTNGTVTFNGQPVSPTSYSHSLIKFLLPVGQGLSNAIVLNVSGQASAPAYFNYTAPSIMLVSPNHGPTIGGVEITLNGTNFGTSGTVTLDGQAQPTTSYNNTQIKFTLQVGQGAGKSIVVGVSGQTSSAATFNYDGPTITNVSPSIGPAAGGIEVTLAGSNFGTNGTVTFNGEPIATTSYTHSQVKFILPAGQGAGNLIAVDVAGQISSPALFSYIAPSITEVLPNHGPTIGGIEITLTGTNFGTNGTLTFEGQPLSTTSYSNALIKFTLPAGQGTNKSIMVGVSGQNSSAASFSYDGPTITNVSPAVGPTDGGIEVTLMGSNFGTNGVVTIGGQQCTITNYSQNQIKFILPAGQGTGKPIIVSVSGQNSPAAFFNYNAPTINLISPNHGSTAGGFDITLTGSNFGSSGIIRFDGQIVSATFYTNTQIKFIVPAGQGTNKQITLEVGGQVSTPVVFNYDGPIINQLSPTTGPVAGGISIALTGTNFGVNGTVTIGGQNCTISSYSHTMIVCDLPAGQGLNKAVIVQVGTQTSNAKLFGYYGSPIATTLPAKGEASTVHGIVNPNGAETTVYFQYGAGTNYGFLSATNLLSVADVASFVTNVLADLEVGAAYHYRVVAENLAGTNYGADLVFTNVPLADLAVSLLASPEAVGVGTNLTYSITVTNRGPHPSLAVSLTNTLPVNVNFVSASEGGVFDSGTVVYQFSNLEAGESTNVTIIVNASTWPGDITNYVSVSGGVLDTNLANNSAFIAVNVNDAPTNILLSNSSVAENQASATAIGILGAVDPNSGDTHTFTLVDGVGSDDNSSFSIIGNSLETAAAFNYESKSSYSVRVRATDVGGLYFEKEFLITISDVVELAVISSQPVSRTNNVGATATFTVENDSSNLGYQWMKTTTTNTIAVTDGGTISGATTASLTINGVVHANEGSYRVVITNSAGSTTSSNATLKVLEPAITLQPGSISVNLSNATSLTVAATGSPGTTNKYQWYFKAATALPAAPFAIQAGKTNTTLSLTNALATQGGSYYAVVTNIYGKTTSSVAVVTVITPPKMPVQPRVDLKTNVPNGTMVWFSVTGVSGTSPSYLWYRDGNLLAATASKWTNYTAKFSDSGTYTVVATNAAGSVTNTNNLVFTVVQDTNKPTVVITKPSALSITTSTTNPVGTVLAYGTATDNARVTNVYYRLNGSAWSPVATFVATVDGKTAKWTNAITAAVGTNTLEAYSVDFSGTNSTISKTIFYYHVPSPITISFDEHDTRAGEGTDSLCPPDYRATVATTLVVPPNNAPTNTAELYVNRGPYKLTAIAGHNQMFTNWTVVENGVTNFFSTNAVITFVMTTNMHLVANFVHNPWMEAAGEYTGLFTDPELSFTNSGFISLLITTNKTFTGKLLIDGDNLALSGSFNVDGTRNLTVSRALKGKTNLFVGLKVLFGADINSGTSSGTNQVIGYVTNGSSVATIRADQWVYKGAGTNPYYGKYTMILPKGEDAALSPGGYGYGLITVATNAKPTVLGALGDSTLFTPEIAPMSLDGKWPVFKQIYLTSKLRTVNFTNDQQFHTNLSYLGAYIGWLTFTNNTDIGGDLKWTKILKAETNVLVPVVGVYTNYYTNGFTNTMAVTGLGYTTRSNDAPTGADMRVVVVTNVLLSFTDGNLTGTQSQAFHLNTNNTIKFITNFNQLTQTNQLGVKATNAQLGALTVTFLSASGKMSGTFTNAISKNPTGAAKPLLWSGAVLQPLNIGYGYFLGTNQSGAVLLQQNPGNYNP